MTKRKSDKHTGGAGGQMRWVENSKEVELADFLFCTVTHIHCHWPPLKCCDDKESFNQFLILPRTQPSYDGKVKTFHFQLVYFSKFSWKAISMPWTRIFGLWYFFCTVRTVWRTKRWGLNCNENILNMFSAKSPFEIRGALLYQIRSFFEHCSKGGENKTMFKNFGANFVWY